MRVVQRCSEPKRMSLVPHEKHAAPRSHSQPRYSGPERRGALHLVEPEATSESVLNIGLWAVIVASLILDVLAVIGAMDVWRHLHG